MSSGLFAASASDPLLHHLHSHLANTPNNTNTQTKQTETETTTAAPAPAAEILTPTQVQASKKLKQSPESSIPIYAHQLGDSPAAHRSPDFFDSDLSATPNELHSTHSHSDPSYFFSPASANTTTHLSSQVETMFQDDESKHTSTSANQQEQKSSSSKSMSNSPQVSRGSSRAHSPVDDGEPEPLQATNSKTTQPQAKPNHTSRSTDPAGQITETELEGKFKVIRYLGKGSYGTVFVAEELATGKQVAIKKIPKVFDNLTNAKRLLREIKILRMLSHHNVIGYRGLLAPSIPATFNSLLIVFEFVDTDLAKLLASDQPITNQHCQYFLYQLLCGINYIHSAQVIHRDIKPANVLINGDCSLKICDFGLSRSTLGPNPTAAAKKAAEDDIASAAKKQAELLANAPKLVQTRQVSTEKVSLDKPQKLARELTKHVVTRWYRAPEVILLSDRYTTAIESEQQKHNNACQRTPI